MSNMNPFPLSGINCKRVDFLGTPFDLIGLNQLLEMLISRPSSEHFEYVVTPNVDHVVRTHRRGLRKLYEDAWLSVCDSRIIIKLARIAGLEIPEVITGSGLTQLVLENYLQDGDVITVIGSSDECISRLKDKISSRLIVNHFNPPMGFINNSTEVEKVVGFVKSNPARFVFLAVGSPQQEILASRLKQGGATGVGFCIGASILFVTGDEKRAPEWIQRLSLEWMYRLFQNPKRLWKRYLLDNPYVFILFLQNLFFKKIS